MLYSKSFIYTQKEDPSDAEVVSHKLMIRAALIHKSGIGLYSWLPLGKRVYDKVYKIIKEEMDNSGAVEIWPPFVTAGDLWKESGRWEKMGPTLLKFQDRHENDYVLGPTHEEAFINIVRDSVQSYKSLPFILYQIGSKFRDEVRSRYGLIRCREFIMKDSYSFDMDEEGLEASYQGQRKAYIKIFKRAGLNTDIVQADSGPIGGSNSEEFIVPSTIGEDTIVKCNSCGYVANVERGESIIPERKAKQEVPVQKVYTPEAKTIEQASSFLGLVPHDLIKAYVFEADGKMYMAAIRGDLQVNEIKLKNFLNATELEVASAERVIEAFGSTIGFIGPHKNCPIEVIMDESVMDMHDTTIGANEPDYHYIGISPKRDCRIDHVASFHQSAEGDTCIKCGKTLSVYKGIEVGHIFKLGRKYTEAMNVKVLNAENKEVIPTCGCYGIGLGRLVATSIEQYADEHGIVFPITIAPYEVIIVPTESEGVIFDFAKEVYDTLQTLNIEVLLDDRNERAGIKFNDADLLGIPLRITIGKDWVNNQKFSVKIRRNGEVVETDKAKYTETIKELIKLEYDFVSESTK